MADLEYVATLNNQQVLAALKSIDTNIDKMANSANQRFESVGQSAGASGAQIGLISGIVSSLTTEFIHLGEKGIDALIGLSAESVRLASDLETTGKIFTGIFQGNEANATAALQRIRKEGRGLGIDLSETSRAFLPFVKSLDELSRVNKISAALAISQPEQGPQGARIALQEALSGNVQSLVRRFEIPKSLGKELQKALEEGGVTDFLGKFEDILKRMGRDLDNLGDTFQLSLGKVTVTFDQLKTAFGVPITDELKKQLNDLDKVLSANYDDFEGLATLAGDVISEIVGGFNVASIAQFFADNKGEIAKFLVALQEIAKSAKELVNIDLSKGINVKALTDAAVKINKIVDALNAIKEISASTGASGPLLGGLKGGLEGLFPGVDVLIKAWKNLDDVIRAVISTYGLFVAIASEGAAIAHNAYQELLVATGQLEEGQKKLIDPQKAYSDAVAKVNQALAEYKKNTKAAADEVSNATIPVKENTDATEENADAALAAAHAKEVAAQAAQDLADAQIKVNKAEEEAAKDYGRKLEDIDKNFERKRLDIAIEFAQKREDAARQNLQKLADIQTKYSQDVNDAQLDLTRKEEDIARKHGQEVTDLERTQRQKRLDIETSYRQKLEDIQREFLIDADEAEKKRDAVAFLRALKQRDEKVRDAQIERSRTVKDTQIEGDRRRQELAIQQKREIEDAKIANERKLEDLRTNLNRQIKAQNLAYERQIEDIAISEQRKNEEAAAARQRDIEDAKTAYDRKLSDLKDSLAAEYETIKEGNAKIEEEQARHNAAMESTTYNPQYANAPVPAGTSHGPSGPSSSLGSTYKPKSIYGYAAGGYAPAGQRAIFGERGPELADVTRAGVFVTPNAALRMNTLAPGGGASNINNSRAQTINLPLASPESLLTPVFVATLRNIISNELGKVL